MDLSTELTAYYSVRPRRVNVSHSHSVTLRGNGANLSKLAKAFEAACANV